MKLNNIIIAAAFGCALPLFMSSCSHEEIDLYSGPKSGIFIQQIYTTDIYGNPLSYREGTTLSFGTYGPEVTGLRTTLVVRSMGPTTDYDRPYRLVLSDATTAREDIDFSLSGNEFCIKAGASTDVVNVNLIRNEGLIQKTVRIDFLLEPNEYFDMPISEFRNSANWTIAGDNLPTNHYFIDFGENYAAPNYWSQATTYFGTWTVTKYLKINEQLGWTVSDWSRAGSTGAKVALGRFPAGATLMQKYLQEQADSGTPVRDPDDPSGYMHLGAGYPINYSAYL